MQYTKEMKTFLDKMKISEQDFEKSGVSWKTLKSIKKAYTNNIKIYEKIALGYIEELSKLDNVHTVRYRIKDVDHLLEKIIRKTLEGQQGINLNNFAEEITDIIGIRVLYVLKSDWKKLHDDIHKKYSGKYAQNPQIKIKEGDPIETYNKIKNVDIEKSVYRSTHYTLRHEMFDESTGGKICTVKVEIQTRSIFEEGWSEINHKFIYKKKLPENIKNEMSNISDILATLTGACDRLGELLKDYRVEAENLCNDQENIISAEEIKEEATETDIFDEKNAVTATEIVDIMEALDIPVKKSKKGK